MVDGTCCRGHRRSRVLRAAGSGGILGGMESLNKMEIPVMMGLEFVPMGNEKYGARVALSRRPNSTLKVLSRTTPPSHLHCQRTDWLRMWLFARNLASRETWEGRLPGVSLDPISSG